MRLADMVALFLCLAPAVFAQAQYGSIGGTIRDTSQAIVPGVTVSIVNSETGRGTAGVTGADGRYLPSIRGRNGSIT